MKFVQRFIANAVAVFLALYLVDSIADGRFVLRGVGVAIILALILGFIDSLVRPLHRVLTKPLYAAITAVLTVFVNALVLQGLAWAQAIDTVDFGWVLGAAAFVTLVTGAINWLIGFQAPEKVRPNKGLYSHDRKRPGHDKRTRPDRVAQPPKSR